MKRIQIGSLRPLFAYREKKRRKRRGSDVIKVAALNFIFCLFFFFLLHRELFTQTSRKVMFEGFYLTFLIKMDCGTIKLFMLPKQYFPGI